MAGSALAIVAVLYLLKPRRRRIDVPFGGLWREVLAQADARVLGRRWRRILSWLLMSLLAILMLGAIGEEHIGLRGCSEPPKVVVSHTAIVIDTSASMQTQDGLPQPGRLDQRSRLEEARDRALQLVRTGREGERFLVFSASGRLRARCGWTMDRDVLTKAIVGVAASDGGLDRQRAMDAASDALIGRQKPRIVLVTDGGPGITPETRAPSVPVLHAVVGPLRAADAVDNQGSTEPRNARAVAKTAEETSESAATSAAKASDDENAAQRRSLASDNLAVVRVSVRAQPGDASRGVLMARIRNDRDAPVVARVEIAASAEAQTMADFQADRSVRAVRKVTVPARRSAWLRIDDLDLSVGRFAVRVRAPADVAWRDRAPWDDWGFAVLAERKRLGVLLVTKGNMFLEAALLANDRYRVRKVTPTAYDPTSRPKGIAVVVLDQVNASFPPGVAGMKFGLASPPGASEKALHEAGDLLVRDHGHPVMRGVTFHDANLDQVRTLPTQAGDQILAGERGGGAILVAREDEVRTLEFGIDLMETDLGARYALPVFMGNAVDWLAGEEGGLLSPVVLGQPFSVQAPVRSESWVWAAPNRAIVPARLSDSQLVGTTEAQGIHEWRTGEGQLVARPTRLPDSERPGLLRAPAKRWTPPTQKPELRRAATPAWAWLLLAAIGLLFVEWLLYHRRRTV